MEDHVAEINYILNATEKESISYIGYSMGTMLMYYSLAMAGQDERLARTFNRIDRFLSITPCAWSNFMQSVDESMQEIILDNINNYEKPFTFGVGSNYDEDIKLMCSMTDMPNCEATMSEFMVLSDTVTIKSWDFMAINSMY